MMNKLKFILGMVTMLFTISIASAQVTASNGEEIAGSPYMDDKYKEGMIYYGDKNYKAPIRYNAYQDLIEYQQNGKALTLDANQSIKKVIVGDEVFVPLTPAGNTKKPGYFALLDSGKLNLYSKKRIVYMPFKKQGKLDGSDQPAEFKKSPDIFYFQLGDGQLQEVDNMKSLIASLPDKQDELTQYVKKEKISPKKEKDLLQFVKYYNSL
ncbi:MAG TPA: hypothetical protein VK589_18100 [Chryseolinea sp.]|nr:hypothetical protein [Chryseolinea sp.]